MADDQACSCPTGKDDIAGGQAVIEGVMMRHGSKIATAVRNPQKEIIFQEQDYNPISKKIKFFGWPFIRGSVNMVEMLMIGMKTLLFSAEIALVEEDKKQPDKWELPLAVLISFSFTILLFIVLPAFFFSQLKQFIASTVLLNIVEGCIRLTIFLAFLSTTLLMEDMRRVFMYHGAEHKTVLAWEDGQELTIENVKPYSTRHPRCGTSFLLVVMVVSIFVFTFLGRPDFLHRILYKLLLMPLVAGISYEVIRFTGKHRSNILVKAISWPGMMMQKITTREPSDDQLEVAIAAMKKVI
ncbi:MAG: DUF1385 domain-containing protein [Candidatus Margulisiibacteriota bacterium]|jgi:uncharacterized protein YqhQ